MTIYSYSLFSQSAEKGIGKLLAKMITRIPRFCIFLVVLCFLESSCSSLSSSTVHGDLESLIHTVVPGHLSSTIVPRDPKSVVPKDEDFSSSTVVHSDEWSLSSTILGSLGSPLSTVVPPRDPKSFLPEDLEYEVQVEDAVKRFESGLKRVRKITGQAIKIAMPYFVDSASSGKLGLSPECQHSLFKWIADLRGLKPYALKMADASAKVVDGILTGTLSGFGSFDQCVEIIISKEKNVRGQYCTIEAWPKLPPKPRFYAINRRLDAFKRFENDTGPLGEFTKYLQLFYMFPFRLGVCIPSTCSREDLFNITQIVSKKFFPANITVPRCEVKQEKIIIENYQIPFLCVLGILTLMVICGTTADILLNTSETDEKNAEKDRGYSTKCILSFSIISNWKILMNTDAGADDLVVLHGVRFFSMCWIIFGHTYSLLNFNVLKHLQIIIELTSQFFFNSITNATLLVDNFFFMSGLLFIYVGTDIVRKTGNIPNPLYFAIHRIWRFLPIQMFFVGVSTLLPLMGDGPMWHENIDPIVNGCRNDWWANFLFINNLYRSSDQGCLLYSWYLASDMQVYLLCIPIVILIMKKPKLGLTVNCVVMVLSVIGVAIQNYIRDLPPALLFTRADIQQRNALMKEAYYPPLHHLGPHNLGILVGYYLRMKKSPKNMHWGLKTLCWIGAFTLTTASLFGVHPWNVGGSDPGKVATVLYASLSRMSWTIGLAWIVIACSTGCGGFLGSILSWKPFIPFSRLTFMTYMIHPLIQQVFYSSLREGIQARNAVAIFIFMGYTVSSYFFAFIACFLLEAPFVNLGKVVFQIEEAIRTRKLTMGTLFSDKKQDKQDPMNNKNGVDNKSFEHHVPIEIGAPNGQVFSSVSNGAPNGQVISRILNGEVISNTSIGAPNSMVVRSISNSAPNDQVTSKTSNGAPNGQFYSGYKHPQLSRQGKRTGRSTGECETAANGRNIICRL
ncbi:hypothetical protein JTE90_022358 [Oedothorax gibbosus]|uniref:Nose resistant-to-fluoxetine protein N-terminal domain-containing protein n=1 Tax=Oedothorax gibbosus TaxID=931172 RepID=A0AAV6VUZ1_9ARAC|nr:hypothetical protein JTE90_022358 [Oedothorax gibbosus]